MAKSMVSLSNCKRFLYVSVFVSVFVSAFVSFVAADCFDYWDMGCRAAAGVQSPAQNSILAVLISSSEAAHFVFTSVSFCFWSSSPSEGHQSSRMPSFCDNKILHSKFKKPHPLNKTQSIPFKLEEILDSKSKKSYTLLNVPLCSGEHCNKIWLRA